MTGTPPSERAKQIAKALDVHGSQYTEDERARLVSTAGLADLEAKLAAAEAERDLIKEILCDDCRTILGQSRED